MSAPGLAGIVLSRDRVRPAAPRGRKPSSVRQRTTAPDRRSGPGRRRAAGAGRRKAGCISWLGGRPAQRDRGRHRSGTIWGSSPHTAIDSSTVSSGSGWHSCNTTPIRARQSPPARAGSSPHRGRRSRSLVLATGLGAQVEYQSGLDLAVFDLGDGVVDLLEPAGLADDGGPSLGVELEGLGQIDRVPTNDPTTVMPRRTVSKMGRCMVLSAGRPTITRVPSGRRLAKACS